MDDLIQCVSCGGRKQIIGLGNMLVDCVWCKGVGFVPFTNKITDTSIIENVTPSNIAENALAKKLGRPRRIVG